ncbi:4-hydroxyphenylacetate 3-monooxygenase, oxygenase component [Halalkalibacter hemicellulosilyticus]|uniref:4-hydroxyphenylacetate 3-monooxygenase n=1 Tax=Halalkalibacter hemicellulosilyticusJCM 9152 TaxID=1236971 RepID=W4QH91_9BACI|nr:4-hydroxyphenylacetate 3-monooxygenase, oxygenase component [Halalkalibacter hemicellulosilyticus]GAE31013.1 4-hydroxyphenylacetate 3-monooxygenase [Halalkalibacter hemicellulosilyticusJCM 9152]
MTLLSGKQYIDRLDQMNNDVWVAGERVRGKISAHPAFKGILNTKAHIYNMYLDKEYKAKLTYSNNGIDQKISFQIPKTIKDLQKRRQATQLIARTNGGTIGRSPDYIHTAIMTLSQSKSFFDTRFQKNLNSALERAIENDLSYTHSFVNPQTNRSTHYTEYLHDLKEGEIIAARMLHETEEGIIIHGARLLATQGGITDEILVLPAASTIMEPWYAFAFTIPSNTKGVRFYCREPYSTSTNNNLFNYPLSSRFDEIDTVVIFDHVLIPWERIFFYNDCKRAKTVFQQTDLNMMLLFQAVSRQIIKTEFLLGISESLASSIAITQYQHIQEKISEIIVTLEIMKALLYRAEQNASPNAYGMMVPLATPLMSASTFYQKMYPKLTDFLHQIGASGLISLPIEADFELDPTLSLEHYLRTQTLDGKRKVQLSRLAWDLTMSAFGSRQTQYERYFFGDPIRLASALYQAYPKEPFTDHIHHFLKE